MANRELSARPGHHAQDPEAIEEFKEPPRRSGRNRRRSRRLGQLSWLRGKPFPKAWDFSQPRSFSREKRRASREKRRADEGLKPYALLYKTENLPGLEN